MGIYACGPTVYGRVHVGNARPFVVFALLKRFLEHEGQEVTLVENVTDVNDKIYDAAREAGVPSAGAGRRDDRPLRGGHRRASAWAGPTTSRRRPRRSRPIVALIADLVEGGHAYDGGRRRVLPRRRASPDYGKLSNRPPEEMQQGEGDDAAELKESPRDFALWKAHKEGEDTRWPAPWGEGRPGWHIECSAMAEQMLGTDFEIHGGGSDLVFPHHENEIAQTEAARGEPLARIWMHNGMVQMGDGEKMAKSVGNIHLLHAALDEYGRDALIMYFAGGHYRQPIGVLRRRAGGGAARGRPAARAGPAARPRRRPRPEALDGLRRAVLRPPGRRLQHARRPRRAVRVGLARPTAASTPGRPWAPGALGEMLHALGLESLLEPDAGEAPDADAERLLAEREAGPGRARLRPRRRAPRRAGRRAARRCATPPRARGSCAV